MGNGRASHLDEALSAAPPGLGEALGIVAALEARPKS